MTMEGLQNWRFSVPEILSLIGVVQSVYILVYVLFRASILSLRGIILPVLYFLVMGAALLSDFAYGQLHELSPYYDVIRWSLWSFITPLSVLLIVQIARITKFPHVLFVLLLLCLVPAAMFIAGSLTLHASNDCTLQIIHRCDEFYDWLNIAGPVAGAISLLSLWGIRGLFTGLSEQKAGKERYWLVLALIMVNIVFLLISLLLIGGEGWHSDIMVLRSAFGLTFLYLVTTSMFRIYPYALLPEQEKRKSDQTLSDDELGVVKKIEDLLALDKIYHEPNYTRTDLAQELGVPESTVSRIINVHFKKSLPQLLNEYRVEDAKILLLDTDASIRIVASEVGFNSLPSFNRVFKEISGQSPSEYRKNMVK